MGSKTMMKSYQKNYQRVEIATADPVRIVVLLYEGAIRNLNIAARNIETDKELASAKICRTLEIVNYLRNALDHEQGGEISLNLQRLYEYMRDQLNEANIHSDASKLAEVVNLLQILLEGWRGISANQTATPEAAIGSSLHAPAPDQAVGLSMMG
jgi:flagellar protein FliS